MSPITFPNYMAPAIEIAAEEETWWCAWLVLEPLEHKVQNNSKNVESQMSSTLKVQI